MQQSSDDHPICVQFATAIMILKNVRYVELSTLSNAKNVRPWKTEARHYIRRNYAMDTFAIFLKSTMRKTVSVKGCAEFTVEDTPQ